jgi:hypothetical protein
MNIERKKINSIDFTPSTKQDRKKNYRAFFEPESNIVGTFSRGGQINEEALQLKIAQLSSYKNQLIPLLQQEGGETTRTSLTNWHKGSTSFL